MPAKVRLLPYQGNLDIGASLSSKMTFPMDGSQVLEKDLLAPKTGKKLLKRLTCQRSKERVDRFF